MLCTGHYASRKQAIPPVAFWNIYFQLLFSARRYSVVFLNWIFRVTSKTQRQKHSLTYFSECTVQKHFKKSRFGAFCSFLFVCKLVRARI